ncbi:putative oxidoreductase [Apostasia shenzhenica]|uniref:Putative oxidoreductase n=1 Tax=Apostasia shenzhenica TaxID=1088818 RepID=A0A2I0A0M3_9ASPA|nr:putative oxidoreductase [Apostasia shenzhenica]
MANPVGFGIMGCAEIARKVCRAIGLAPNATVVAVGSRSVDKARRFIANNGLPEGTRAHGSYEDLLDDPKVDAVYVPLPTSLHVRWAVAAAGKGKHVLLEKPTALCVAELDQILEACESNGVQFMDGTMWMHHPRTTKMRELLSDPNRFGKVKLMNSTFSLYADPNFLQNDIRVKPDLDSLGSLGDAGWYCIRATLWANDYELPKTAIAFPHSVKNEAGVVISSGASLHWEDGRIATFHCSFLAHLTMELSVIGSKGALHLSDFIVPFEENAAGFTFASDSWFTDLVTGWQPLPSKHVVSTDLPQEALMVTEFSKLVGAIKDSGSKPERKWPIISRKTQAVLDAVKTSIDNGSQPAEIVLS